ncbi:MAG: HNH endonuclease [Ardenticatenaceae bacterium]|nr:HNH endonuclease [Ardenticatenaceae bacterium]
MSQVPRKIRDQIAAEAKHRCGYCLMQEVVSGIPLTLEHIVPQAKDGSDETENLWLSCRLCNEAKHVLTEHQDPQTGEMVPLFNPRYQIWHDHFRWHENGTIMVGLTAVGRATIEALSLNSELRQRSRAIWVEAGYHPPD